MDSTESVNSLAPWFHNIHLPDGIQTAPQHFLGDFPSFKWKELAPAIPQDLTGKKVLDVGCNAGYYSIELAKRGAQVLGIDVDEHYLRQARWVAERFGLEEQLTFRQMQVYDLAHLDEEFDLIWFMGVFYHLRYPLLALDILGRRCRDRMVFQTLTMPGELPTEEVYDSDIHQREQLLRPDWPKMAFIEHNFAGDPTNWWLANQSAMRAMLRSSGFTIVGSPSHETLICQKNPDQESSVDTWNKSEYLSAIQADWQEEVQVKTRK
jgi:tRNA (mo5U34)-methyltransferase